MLLLQLLCLLVLTCLPQRLQPGQHRRVQSACWWGACTGSQSGGALGASLCALSTLKALFPPPSSPPRALLLRLPLVLAFAVAGVAVAEGTVLSNPALQHSLLVLALLAQRLLLVPLLPALHAQRGADTSATAGVYPQPGVRNRKAAEHKHGQRVCSNPKPRRGSH